MYLSKKLTGSEFNLKSCPVFCFNWDIRDDALTCSLTFVIENSSWRLYSILKIPI